MTGMCDDTELQELAAAIQADDGDELVRIDRLIGAHPDDARLHFLRGSILASIGRSIEALASLRRATDLAPDFAIARFQLGFFQLTSGEPAEALASWGPIALLPQGHYLRLFVGGLTHLIRDEFEDSVQRLREGIAANDENPALNGDMQLIIDKVVELVSEASAREQGDSADPASATSMLLGQFAGRRPS